MEEQAPYFKRKNPKKATRFEDLQTFVDGERLALKQMLALKETMPEAQAKMIEVEIERRRAFLVDLIYTNQ